jgi:single-strand DNA-binding protein
MPASFNKVLLIGNLTRDPELRYTPKGTAVAKIGMAVTRHWSSENGERKEEVTFVDVDVFGRLAENAGQYLKKGRQIMVEGRLKLDQWEDKQTRKPRSKLGVVAESLQFLGAKADGDAAAPSAPRQETPAAAPSGEAKPNAEAAEDDEDDVPF